MPQLKNWATTSDNICKQTRHIYVMYSIYIHVHNSCGIRPNFVCTQAINILSTYYQPKIFKKVKYEVSEVKSQDTNMNIHTLGSWLLRISVAFSKKKPKYPFYVIFTTEVKEFLHS